MAAAQPWKAYKQGLEDAADDEAVTIDLDEVLVDVVALGIGHEFEDRLEASNEAGEPLRAFASQESGTSSSIAAVFPWWVAFNSATGASGSGGTVAGGGAGGGGGAAGST